ncbi:MAG: amidohydrolase family protein [Chloroflexota bacterium]
MERIILRGARIVDGRGLRHERADLLVEGDAIADIAPGGLAADAPRLAGARVIDLTGLTLAPGLMNAHAHITLDGSADPDATLRGETPTETAIRGARRLEETLRMGVTGIRDVGGVHGIGIALARMVERGEIPGPRMLAAGNVITMTGGHGHWMGVEVDGPDAVRRGVRGQIKAGATTIKVMATGGMMTPGQRAGAPQLTVEEMAAAVEEAHKADKIVAAHVESDEGGRNAVLAGVDSVEHGHGMTAETIALMLDRGTALDPTILSDKAIIEAPPDAGIPAFVVDKCRPLHQSLLDTLEIAFARGVTITAGNDGGAPLVHIGDMAAELAIYVALGMHPRDALASATINDARLFGFERTGYVETGWVADLIALRGDPLADIGALRDPAFVMARGIVAVTPG